MSTQAHPVKELDRKGLSGPVLRTFFRIAELWELSVDDQMTLLGGDLLQVEEGSEHRSPVGHS